MPSSRTFATSTRLALWQAIDAFRQEGVSAETEGMEILVRRLVGLQKADAFNDNGLLTAMEWRPPSDVVPRRMMRTIIKDAERQTKLKEKKKPRKRTGTGEPAPQGDRKQQQHRSQPRGAGDN